MEGKLRDVRRYLTTDGKVPFEEWFENLRDLRAITKIEARLKRVSLGNLGDYKAVGGGVFELRIRIKRGLDYRIYFGQKGETLILLLCGGGKSTQQQDIEKAKEFWKDYERCESSDE
ncbi:MAG: type II toxin-antitoxin system RelE/ParE family toxin [Oscillatoriales cyanobacterium C42_A2020_001]|nr:type II toxin-antitoxin system RelE/ParE family toxin [Leptolyngbyaceae cyanobacterium C42_A2020_001]